MTLTMTSTGRALEVSIRKRTGLSRGDLYELLLRQFGDQVVSSKAAHLERLRQYLELAKAAAVATDSKDE